MDRIAWVAHALLITCARTIAGLYSLIFTEMRSRKKILDRMETDLASKEQVWIGILDYKTVIFFPRTPFKKEYQSIYWPVNLGKKNKDD